MEIIEMNQDWREAETNLGSTDGIPSINHKLEIAGADLYCQIGFDKGRAVYVSLNLSRGKDGDPDCEENARQETRHVDDVRGILEILCKQASALLQSGVWTLDHLEAAWRGTRFRPEGPCSQLKSIVSSPLDAVSRLISLRKEEWGRRMAA